MVLAQELSLRAAPSWRSTVDPSSGKAVRPTCWDGIDLIAAAPFLFSAEFALPSMRMGDTDARFWDVLNQGLEPLRHEYDVTILPLLCLT